MDFEHLFVSVEAAIDAHPHLKRVPGIMGEPDLHVSRLGYTILIPVTLKGSRRKPIKISGDGNTAEEAAESLIDRLDHWAQAIGTGRPL